MTTPCSLWAPPVNKSATSASPPAWRSTNSSPKALRSKKSSSTSPRGRHREPSIEGRGAQDPVDANHRGPVARPHRARASVHHSHLHVVTHFPSHHRTGSGRIAELWQYRGRLRGTRGNHVGHE